MVLRCLPRGNVPTHTNCLQWGRKFFVDFSLYEDQLSAQRDIFSSLSLCGEFSFSLRRFFVRTSWIFTPTHCQKKNRRKTEKEK
jgi:hypothetical protein